MLLYYFADKDELLTATLARIATRMTVEFDHAVPAEPPRPFAVLLQQVWAAMASESLHPFMPCGSPWRRERPEASSRTATRPRADRRRFPGLGDPAPAAGSRSRAGRIGADVYGRHRRPVPSQGHRPRRPREFGDHRACGALAVTSDGGAVGASLPCGWPPTPGAKPSKSRCLTMLRVGYGDGYGVTGFP